MFTIDRKSVKEGIMSKRKTTEEFVTQSQELHDNKYSYEKVEYIDANTEVTITCKEHGDFGQLPCRHLAGKGCPACGLARRKKSRANTTESFIEEAKAVHPDKYNYDKVNYVNNHTKVTITCPIHGDFEQRPADHKKQNGCPGCAEIARANYRNTHPTGWRYSAWEAQGKISKDFEGFSLYLIECTSRSTGEKFIKVGKTFRSVTRRFSTEVEMPYMFRVLTQVYHNAFAISKLEEAVKREFMSYKYTPKKDFDGRSECLSVDCVDNVLMFIHDKESYKQSTNTGEASSEG
jgi:hypothetical protein